MMLYAIACLLVTAVSLATMVTDLSPEMGNWFINVVTLMFIGGGFEHLADQLKKKGK